MDNDKPFKTIEVVDSRTNQKCKIACMSCIRGHRTTSCGIPVCRTKIFWTVKRPGRPSNSCTCMYGSTGGCKCVVAKATCPHKPKKGEKRTVDCRCDEQGRYCCFLEPKHWDQLMALEKPTVDFFRTKEELEARHAAPAQTPATFPATPSFLANSPAPFSVSSTASTPAPQGNGQHLQFIPSEYNVRSPSHSIAPRFGLMGLGTPQISGQSVTPGAFSWDDVPPAPREYQNGAFAADVRIPEDKSCCQGPSSPPAYQFPSNPHTPGPPSQSTFAPFGDLMPNVSFPEEPPPVQPSSFERFANDYFNHQFPSAICQTCGLAGCTCRMCPPVLQNVNNGSWAQCCGRKHARTTTYVAPSAPAVFEEPSTYALSTPPPQHQYQEMPHQQFNQTPAFPQQLAQNGNGQSVPSFPDEPYFAAQHPHPSQNGSPPDFSPFDPGDDFGLGGGGSGAMDLSEFLIQDLDRPPETASPQIPALPPASRGQQRGDELPVQPQKRGCCCGGDG